MAGDSIVTVMVIDGDFAFLEEFKENCCRQGNWSIPRLVFPDIVRRIALTETRESRMPSIVSRETKVWPAGEVVRFL